MHKQTVANVHNNKRYEQTLKEQPLNNLDFHRYRSTKVPDGRLLKNIQNSGMAK